MSKSKSYLLVGEYGRALELPDNALSIPGFVEAIRDSRLCTISTGYRNEVNQIEYVKDNTEIFLVFHTPKEPEVLEIESIMEENNRLRRENDSLKANQESVSTELEPI